MKDGMEDGMEESFARFEAQSLRKNCDVIIDIQPAIKSENQKHIKERAL